MENKVQEKYHYIDNDKFLAALIEHRQLCDEAKEKGLPPPRLSNYIGECFLLLVENLAKRPNFRSYSYIDEMKEDAIENLMMGYNAFNPNHTTESDKVNYAFSYFNRICWRAFIRRIFAEKKQHYIKYKATARIGFLDDEEYAELDDGNFDQHKLYDNLYDAISSFESLMAKKKEKAKKPRGLEKFLEIE